MSFDFRSQISQEDYQGKIKDDLKNVLILAQTPDFRIGVMESNIDHIHFLIDYDPILY